MRIVTRPDFDGVVCAVLLKAVLGSGTVLVWTQPNQIQNGQFEVEPHDVLANLPHHPNCALWFDHHVSNAVKTPFSGLFRIAPSAAGLVKAYYQSQLQGRFDTLVAQADKIDSADLELDEILHPEAHPFILLSMAIALHPGSSAEFCDLLVDLIGRLSIDRVLAHEAVTERCRQVVQANRAYEEYLRRHTVLHGVLSVTDFRGLTPVPEGNRFLVYSLFPDSVVNMKLFDEGPNVVIKLGHSIINRGCRVNVGKLLARYNGGGHRGAGAGRLARDQAERELSDIMKILMANQTNEK